MQNNGPHMQYGSEMRTCCGIPAAEQPVLTEKVGKVRCAACLEVIAAQHDGSWRREVHIEYGHLRTACGIGAALGPRITVDVTKLTCPDCREFAREQHVDGHLIAAAG